MNKTVAVYDNTISARTYLSYIAEQAGGFACIGRDGKLYIKTIGESSAELPIEYFEKFKWGEKFKCSRIRYEDGVQLFQKGNTTGNTIYINQDNMYITSQEQIDNIYNKLNGLEIYSFEGSSIIDPALDLGDILIIDGKKVIYQGSSEYGGKFKASISSKIQGKEKEDTMTKTTSQKNINRRVESRINQVEGKIEQTVSEVDEQNQKISQVVQTVDKLEAKISDVTNDITSVQETMKGWLEFEKINKSEPIHVEIYPIEENIWCLKPSETLFPSDDLFIRLRHLRFTNTTTNEVFDYELPDDLLYYDNEHFDTFIMDYNSQTCYVNKKCKYDSNGNVALLEKERIDEYEYPHIYLSDGNYKIQVLKGTNKCYSAYLQVRLMVQNLYTDQFATKVELNSELKQTASEIDLSVNKKLSNYSTTSEMNSAISLMADSITSTVSSNYATKTQLKNEVSTLNSTITQKADSILSSVAGTYATKDTLKNYSTTTQMNSAINQKADSITSTVATIYATKDTLKNYSTTTQMNSAINQKADSISATVSKKVGYNEIISSINQSAESVTINASKINLSGYLTISNASNTYASKSDLSGGKTTISGNCLTTGTINANNCKITNINADNITSGTISASKIKGGSLDLTGTITTIKSTNFNVDKNGNITCTSGTIGGFTLNSTSFTKSLNGLYQYTGFDLYLLVAHLMDYINIKNDRAMFNILDADGDSSLNSADMLRMVKIKNGTIDNTKVVKGTVAINSDNPKNCFSIKDSSGNVAVSIGVGGINTNDVVTQNIVCTNTSYNFSDSIPNIPVIGIDGINGRISVSSSLTHGPETEIHYSEIRTPVLTQTSREESKKNFEKLENGLDIIKNTEIYKYNLKTEDDDKKKHIGFVIGKNFKYANEITAIDKDKKEIGADIYSMVSVAYKAIQEQEDKIEKLYAIVEKIANRMEV